MKKLFLGLLAGSAVLFSVSAAENLLTNGDFKSPKGWGLWQAGKTAAEKTGVCKIGNGKMEMKSVKNGCYLQTIRVKGGEQYVYTVTGSNTSKGDAAICLAFLNDKGWIPFRKTAKMPADGKTATLVLSVTVPKDATRMSVQLCAAKQTKEDTGVITFTKAELQKK